MNDCPVEFKPIFYRRYVDDCFLIFRHIDHVNKFLVYLNSKHNDIKFTCDVEHNNSLPFLDTYIYRDNNTFESSVYRNPTFSGLGTQFF